MSTQPILEGEGYQALKNKSSMGEILETASSFEYSAHIFYLSLRDKIAPELRNLVIELAAEEKIHFDLFQSLSKHPHTLEHHGDLVEMPPSNHRFSGYLQAPQLGDFADDKAILHYAMGREQAAMEQYSTLAREAPDGPIRDLFYYLAHEELQHKKELEKKYEELLARS